MTYEDVTNVDSVGIITARKQLHVGTGVSIAAGGLNVTAGVSTFTAIQVSGTAAFTSNLDLGDATSDTITFVGRVDSDLNPSGSTRDLGTSGVEWRAAYLLNGVVASDTIATHSGDSNTKIRFPAADTLSVETGGAEALRVDSSQRLVVGATSSNNVGGFGGAAFQVEGLTAGTSALSLIRHSANTVGSTILMGKTRGTSDAAVTIVQDDDNVARIIAYGADGTDTESSLGAIQFDVDGTPGANDMPGRIVFSTTPDGSATYTERLRIDSRGQIGVGVVPTAQYAHNLIQIGHQATLGANAALSATGQTFLTHNLYFDTGGTLKVFNTSNANEGAIFRLVDGQLLFSNSAATTGTPTVTERLRIDSSGRLIQRYSAAPYNNRAATFQAPAEQTSTYIAVINTETNGASGCLLYTSPSPRD